jgi:hypothetical protein
VRPVWFCRFASFSFKYSRLRRTTHNINKIIHHLQNQLRTGDPPSLSQSQLLETPSLSAIAAVENAILEKVRSGASGQTFVLPAKKKVSEQMEVASAPTYASILKKGLKWAPVTVHSF